MSDDRLRHRDDGDVNAGDEPAARLRKDGQPDGRSANRFKRPDDRAEGDRARAARATSDERDEMTDDDRLMLLASSSLDTIMPNLPTIQGYSLCWVSPTHPSDTPTNRLALGWLFVTKDDMPQYENLCVKSGEHVGAIACREMVLMKIRNELRQRYLTLLHHTKPQQELEALTSGIHEMKDGRGKAIGMIEGDGLQREAPKKPDFAHMF